MAKLKLSDKEVALIRGLSLHKGFNDQQAVAVFSYPDRNIRHCEIGAMRKGTEPRYAAIPAAPESETHRFVSLAHCELLLASATLRAMRETNQPTDEQLLSGLVAFLTQRHGAKTLAMVERRLDEFHSEGDEIARGLWMAVARELRCMASSTAQH